MISQHCDSSHCYHRSVNIFYDTSWWKYQRHFLPIRRLEESSVMSCCQVYSSATPSRFSSCSAQLMWCALSRGEKQIFCMSIYPKVRLDFISIFIFLLQWSPNKSFVIRRISCQVWSWILLHGRLFGAVHQDQPYCSNIQGRQKDDETAQLHFTQVTINYLLVPN